MIPLAEDLVSEIQKAGAASGGASVAGAFEFLSPGVEAWAQALSADTALAYVETEYAAGIEAFEFVGLSRHRSLDEWLQDAG